MYKHKEKVDSDIRELGRKKKGQEARLKELNRKVPKAEDTYYSLEHKIRNLENKLKKLKNELRNNKEKYNNYDETDAVNLIMQRKEQYKQNIDIIEKILKKD